MVEKSEDYDLLPHEEVTRLRREVEDIKANPFGSSKEGKELLKAMNRLSESMDHLTGLFQEAAEQMKLEEREAELIGQKLDPLFGQMSELIDQNKKIAKGIIAVADMVHDTKSAPRPSPMPRVRVEPTPMGGPPPGPPPMSSSPPPMSGAPSMPPPMPTSGMPPGRMPPPPGKPKKKGLFSFGK